MIEGSEWIYLISGVVFCFMMTWGVGANDLANVMSTTMGSKAISARKAVIIAIIFEFLGAFIGGNNVTETMRDGIIEISQLDDNPQVLIEGMLALLMAGTIWMNLASFLGLPVSITNAIVGSMVGFGCVVLGVDSIHWQQVAKIAVSWITSPMISGIFAYLIMLSIQILIFGKKDPLKQTQLLLPTYLFAVGIVMGFITVFKGIDHFHIELALGYDVLLIICSSLCFTMLGLNLVNRIDDSNLKKRREKFNVVERKFAILVAFTTCAMVFAHGANDVSIAVGPLSVIYSLVVNHAKFNPESFPSWITLLGCAGVISGLILYGRKVIETVGSSITALTPSRAFAATFAAATTVVFSTSTGIPVSATQTLVGAVLGVGLARGIGALNLIVIRNIFMSWIVTLPASSLLTIGCYHFIHYLNTLK